MSQSTKSFADRWILHAQITAWALANRESRTREKNMRVLDRANQQS